MSVQKMSAFACTFMLCLLTCVTAQATNYDEFGALTFQCMSEEQDTVRCMDHISQDALHSCMAEPIVANCWMNDGKPFDTDVTTSQAILPDRLVFSSQQEDGPRAMTWGPFVSSAFACQLFAFQPAVTACIRRTVEVAMEDCAYFGDHTCWW